MRDFWFWRDVQGREVDLLFQDNQLLNIMEIKASQTIMSDMFKGLNFFTELAKDSIKDKFLVNSGAVNQKRSAAEVIGWEKIEKI